MLYLIGLGLNEKGISVEGKEILKKCKKVFLEGYTVDFPYSVKDLEKVLGKKIEVLDREKVEQGVEEIVNSAKKENVALLVYGAPLSATTHISIIQECKEKKVKVKIIHAGSIFDGIGETGLQLYKFGKIASMPAWTESYKPKSFIEIVKDNKKINAHSLILIDIGLEFEDAFKQLKESLDFDKIIVCSQIGKKSKIFYDKKFKNIKKPFCFIIPGKLHFVEEEFLEGLEK